MNSLPQSPKNRAPLQCEGGSPKFFLDQSEANKQIVHFLRRAQSEQGLIFAKLLNLPAKLGVSLEAKGGCR